MKFIETLRWKVIYILHPYQTRFYRWYYLEFRKKYDIEGIILNCYAGIIITLTVVAYVWFGFEMKWQREEQVRRHEYYKEMREVEKKRQLEYEIWRYLGGNTEGMSEGEIRVRIIQQKVREREMREEKDE